MNEALAINRGSRISDRYTLLEKIGVGGQGEVWRARDENRGVDIALKLLNPSVARNDAAWAALEREYSIVSRLDHPGILRIYPPQRDGESAVLPMDLASGGDLRKLRGANYLEIVPVLIEIAQALEHAHERGVVHRDLKPGNVLFDSCASVRIADFGVAGAAHVAGDLARPAAPATRPGLSPFTASPEQLRGEPPAIADDVYGLGALAYELLSGYPPYYPHFELRRVLEEPVPDLKSANPLPLPLATLVMRMLAKKPEQRPQSMREVIDVLDATLNDTLAFEFDDLAAQSKPAATMAAKPIARESPPRTEPRAADLPPRAKLRAADRPPSAKARAVVEPAVVAPADRDPETSVARPEPVPWSASSPSYTPPQGPRAPWVDQNFEVAAKHTRREPQPARRGPWVALAVLAVLAFGAFYWLPRYAPPELLDTPPFDAPQAKPPSPQIAAPPAPASTEQNAGASKDESAEARLAQTHANFKQRLASLESRAAGVWGGADFAAAKARAAESVGAYDARDVSLAEERINDAMRLLANVESRAPRAHAAQLAAGDRALAAGQQEVARQAFEFALRIDPNSARAADSLRRVQSLGGVLPLLADGQNAETEKDYARAVQDYSQALKLDPNNPDAKAGLGRANAALGEDNYAKAIGTGFAALGAGRLEDARVAFEKARGIRPTGAEAQTGLKRVDAALSARGFASARQRGAALEAEERWSDALKEYEAALKLDPSLAFAQEGKARAAERAQLATALQALIDEPERLAAPSVRAEANALIQRANAIARAGPVLRSQIARLEILLPEFDKPVRLALVSDNTTEVAIQRVGDFGSFARREIELKPGKYTVVGTRAGYRDVRRDVTIAPGSNNEVQTISVSCVEPI
jgi:serine/threonine protein kinase/tetratricopeptide (TPR) repeat protein